ncbi:MAG TPA: HindIII family type II restriction endonuclease, partial [Treponemataceae bacterium]|nr:HindIII family type II restriction endonuclease [Treponemataceae bacterium]
DSQIGILKSCEKRFESSLSMDVWKRGKPYAMVVCPIHQLPNTSSQIYQQATARNVCIFTYSHLSLLLNFSNICGKDKAQELLEIIFKVIPALNPSKDANNYWLAINKTILSFSKEIDPLWKIEKEASIASILIIFYPSNFSNGNTSMAFQFRKVHH